MRIENEMWSRLSKGNKEEFLSENATLSQELDFFFDNVMDSVVDYFQEKVTV